jgi:hypothetical protein
MALIVFLSLDIFKFKNQYPTVAAAVPQRLARCPILESASNGAFALEKKRPALYFHTVAGRES